MANLSFEESAKSCLQLQLYSQKKNHIQTGSSILKQALLLTTADLMDSYQASVI
jgi:hypothetical protein